MNLGNSRALLVNFFPPLPEQLVDDNSIAMTAHINEHGQLVNDQGQIINEHGQILTDDGQPLVVDETVGAMELEIKGSKRDPAQLRFVCRSVSQRKPM